MAKIINRAIQLSGETMVISGITLTVKELSVAGNVFRGEGATVPTDGLTGFSKGCYFVLTSSNVNTAGHTVYVNEGDHTSCDFNLSAQSVPIQSKEVTVATSGNTDVYIIAPVTGNLGSLRFSGHDALAASDTNYITWTATNLGQAGAGSTAMLSSTPAGTNTTKVTGGTALSLDTVRLLSTSGPANLAVAKGDRILVRAAVTGTLANTVTLASYLATFN